MRSFIHQLRCTVSGLVILFCYLVALANNHISRECRS